MIFATKPKKRKKASISFLTHKLDSTFSKWVRLSYTNADGAVQCYTCDKFFHWKKIQNGHYVSRFYKSVRWHPDNCRPQCMWCNMFKKGDVANYRERLVKELGEPTVLGLDQARHISQKLDHDTLQRQIDQLQDLLEQEPFISRMTL